MSIWEHAAPSRDVTSSEVYATNCIYCSIPLRILKDDHQEDEDSYGYHNYLSRVVVACPCCGWWYVREDAGQHLVQEWVEYVLGASGTLRNLDLTDLSIPIDEIRAFLCAKYESRFELHPKLFEETVASVFEDLGYRVRVTGRSGDDGIDVVLNGDKGDTVGVQVKRYRLSITVEQIRSFAGAMILGGYTQGIYVTTSSYQRGAQNTVARFAARGLGIRLFDALRFYEAIQISQRNAYTSPNDSTALYNHCGLHTIHSRSDSIEE